jgi:hypothetical protein
VTTIALELERALERLEPEKAKVLESKVREAISLVAEEKHLPTIEEMKRRMPEFAEVIGSLGDAEFDLPEDLPTLEEIKRKRPDLAHIIGAWADEDPDEPEELPMPPAKTW